MNRNERILLGILLKSTSSFNRRKYSTDAKKKKKATGKIVAYAIVYFMLIVYCFLGAIGFGALGISDVVPYMSIISISAMSFFLTLFKTNGYLFGFKEYDMLMSMPIEVKSIARAKFMYMYIKSVPLYMVMALSMMVGYVIFAHPAWYVYLYWILLSLAAPVIPMLIAAFFGFLIAKFGSGFKHGKVIQMILTFAFIIFCMSLQFIIEAFCKDGKAQENIEMAAASMKQAESYYLPIKWYANAINEGSILYVLLFLAVSFVLLEVIFLPVARFYRQINSRLKSNAARGKYKPRKAKMRSVYNAIAFKELKRMTGSTVYMTNVFVGEIIAVILGVLSLVVGVEKMIAVVTENAPFDYGIVSPAIPFIIYFLVGMVSTTACSPSLEGKNYWIVQSLPIEPKVLYRGKLLFQMYLSVPFMTFGVLCMSISAGVSPLNVILNVILGVALCAFSGCFGLRCGLKHMRLDWENEIEVVKQGTAVALYLFPNMFGTMGLVVAAIALGFVVNPAIITVAATLIALLLAWLCCRKYIK